MTPIANQTTGVTLGHVSTITFGSIGTGFIVGQTGCSGATVTENTLVGDFISVEVGFDTTSFTVSSITDDMGTNYTPRATLTGSVLRIETWGGFAGSTNAANNIVIHTTSAFYTCGVMVDSYKGVGLTATVQTSSGIGTSAAATLITSVSNAWVIGGAIANGTSQPSAGANTNVRNTNSLTSGCSASNPCMGLDQVDSGIVTSPKSVTLASTLSQSEPWTTTAIEIDPLVIINKNVTATPGFVPIIQLIPFAFAGLVLGVLAYDFVQKRIPGGL